MRDIIQKIVATETEATQKVHAARAAAEQILSDTRKRAQEVVEAARQSARLDADEVLVEALQTAEVEARRRLAQHLGQPQPFYLEAVPDCGYFQELLAKISRLSGGDQTVVRPLALREANFFQFMLATQG